MTLVGTTRRSHRLALGAVCLLAVVSDLSARPSPPADPSPTGTGESASSVAAEAFQPERGGPKLRFLAGSRTLIPIQINNNHVWTRGSLGDSDSISILFDTGAYGDCIRAARALALGLRTGHEHQALGAGGTVASATTEPLDLRLPGFELRGDRLNTLPLEEIGGQAGRDLDVIVGHPLFSRAVVAVDYQAGTMEIDTGKDWEYRGPGTILPLTFDHHLPYVTARVTIPGHDPIEGRFVIDTGSAAMLILSPEFIERHHVLESIPKTVQAQARGVGGSSMNPVGRVDRIELGGIAIDRPITMFQSAGPGHISAPGTLGNIGGGILRRFRVIFDYRRSRMILEPNPRLAEPFEYDMSGLSLRAIGPDYQKLMIARVLEGSPATEVGLKVGDELESVDGHAAFEIGLDSLREMFRRNGEEHRLAVIRNGERIEATLKTRRMI